MPQAAWTAVRTIAACVWVAGGSPAAADPPYITGVNVKATTEQHKAIHLVRDSGLTQSPPGSGNFVLSADIYAGGGSMWCTSGKEPIGKDELPYVEFDFGKDVLVAGFRVWNYNEAKWTYRGFRAAAVQISDDAMTWRTLPWRFEFAQAPGTDGYAGEKFVWPVPLQARYVRFACLGNYRRGGNPDASGLGKVRFFAAEKDPFGVVPLSAGGYPTQAGLINVKEAPYRAAGDGKTDDFAALQQALDDFQGTGRPIFLPAGTYLISRGLKLKPAVGGGNTRILGQGREHTTLRLADGALPDPKQPAAVLNMGWNGTADKKFVSADWFHNFLTDLTIDCGHGNPGAIALEFYSNNTGIARDLTLTSPDGVGAIGLQLGGTDQNGPLLCKNILIRGFEVGIVTAASVNSQTLEHIRVEKYRVAGWQNFGQTVSARTLHLEGTGRGVEAAGGYVCLVDSEIHGTGDAALAGKAQLFVRNLKTAGFKHAIHHDAGEKETLTAGPLVQEFASAPPRRLFGDAPTTSLALEAPDTPAAPSDDAPETWACVRDFRRTDDPDDTAAFRRATESGAKTVYFPAGWFHLSERLIPGPNVRRVLGFGATLASRNGRGGIAVGDGNSTVFEVRDLNCPPRQGITLENAGLRTLVVRNCKDFVPRIVGRGDTHFENVVCEPLEVPAGRKFFARQFNQEFRGTKLTNDGGRVWILGFKSESGGSLIHTKNGGRTELLGGLYYSHEGNLAPMFVVEDATVSLSVAEVCYTGNPFKILVRETHAGTTRELPRTAAPQLPLFRSGK